METNRDYVSEYYAAYSAMKDAAIKAIKEYGKELDVVAILKKQIVKGCGYESEDEISNDELTDSIENNLYYCLYEDKHGFLADACITKVRYNKKNEYIEVYLESDDGFIDGWYSDYVVSHDTESIYITVLEYINFAN